MIIYIFAQHIKNESFYNALSLYTDIHILKLEIQNFNTNQSDESTAPPNIFKTGSNL